MFGFFFFNSNIEGKYGVRSKSDTFLSPRPVAGTYHGCSGRSLVDLVLGCFDLHLQVSGRVEVFALLPRAAALNVVHTHSDGVVVGVDHRAVRRVGEAAVVLPAGAVAPLVFATHLQTDSFAALMFFVSGTHRFPFIHGSV